MKKLWVENIENIPSVIYSDLDYSNTHVDSTSDAIALDLHGTKALDYIFVRDKINQVLFIEANPNYPTIDFTGWFTMSSAKKEIMARYILAPYALRLTVYSDGEDKKNWFYLLEKTQGMPTQTYTGRAYVIEECRKYIAGLVRIEQFAMSASQDFYKDVFEFAEWYVAAACPDFKCWVTNEAGSQYENDGFAQKSYFNPITRDGLMLIYNGE